MQLKYVGAKPSVSGRGVSFDQTKPDRYTFLNAAFELLEALEHAAVTDRTVDLNSMQMKIYSGSQMQDLMEKYCPEFATMHEAREKKTKELIEKYTLRVKNNANISEDERRAWLNNIKIMYNYYLQYVTNEMAYECALDTLADKLSHDHINIVIFPLGHNYGLVFSHLIHVLTDHKPPADAEISMIEMNHQTVGQFDMHKPAPADL